MVQKMVVSVLCTIFRIPDRNEQVKTQSQKRSNKTSLSSTQFHGMSNHIYIEADQV